MILAILITAAAFARIPTGAEKPLWDASPERIECIAACKAKNPMQVNIVCDGGAHCDCSARCFETDGPKFCARIDAQAPELQAAETYHAGSVESVNSGVASLIDGIETSDKEKITFGVEAIEAAKKMSDKENAIRAHLNLPAAPLTAPKGLEEKIMRIENKIPRESFLSQALESPRALVSSLGFEHSESGAGARGESIARAGETGSAGIVASAGSEPKRAKGLRDALKRKLGSLESEAPTESTSVNTMTGLAPLEVFQLEKESLAHELNLFDVVRLKYRAKERMMKGE